MLEKYHKQLELNGTKRRLVYADNLFGQKINIIKYQKNNSDEIKEVHLVVNADKANWSE